MEANSFLRAHVTRCAMGVKAFRRVCRAPSKDIESVGSVFKEMEVVGTRA
jgi:hypothetical protein